MGRAPQFKLNDFNINPEVRKKSWDFSVATTEKRKNASGEQEERTIWFRDAAWGRQAELAAEYLAKSSQVYVEGRLRLSTSIARAIRGPAPKSTPATYSSWGSVVMARMGLRRG